MKKAYMIVGEANAAKTTYLDLLTELFGEEYVSTELLQNLGDRFNKFTLVDKFVNVGDDLPDVNLSAFNELKTLTGKRKHDVEPKHLAKYSADITAVHVFTANKPPEIPEKIDTDDAWWERWVFLYFQNQFKKVSSWFDKNVKPNMEGFLLLVLQEVAEIIRNGGKLRFEQPMEEARNKWKHTSSVVDMFIESETERDLNKTIPKEELLVAIKDWCDSFPDGMEKDRMLRRVPTTQTALTKSLIRIGGIDTTQLGKKKIPAYKGIGWKSNSRYKPTESKNGNL